MVGEQEAGRRSINRSQSWQKGGKDKEEKNWYKTRGRSTVIFCPYTPGSELAKKWWEIEAKEEESRGWRYKVVEQGGRQLRSMVCKNPWAGQCNDPEGFICSTAPLEGQATADNRAAPTMCNALPSRCEDRTLYRPLRRLDGAEEARVRLECPALPSTMDSRATLPM